MNVNKKAPNRELKSRIANLLLCCFDFFVPKNALFLKGADRLSTNLHFDFLAIDNKSLGLQIRLPDFFGVPLREAHVVAVLLTFAG